MYYFSTVYFKKTPDNERALNQSILKTFVLTSSVHVYYSTVTYIDKETCSSHQYTVVETVILNITHYIGGQYSVSNSPSSG
jgi:hypothetical protein